MADHIYRPKNRDVWLAALDIPEKLRAHYDGKRRLVQSTSTSDRQVAKRRAAVLVAQWKGEFDKLRTVPTDPLEADAKWLRDALLKYRQDPQEVELLTDMAVEKAEELLVEQGIERAQEWYREATGATVPTLEHLENWLRVAPGKPRHLDQQRHAVKMLASRFEYLHQIETTEAQQWLNALVVEDGKAPSTVRTYLQAWRAYLKHLRSVGVVKKDFRPLEDEDLKVPTAGNGTKQVERQAWSPQEVLKLHREALRRDDQELADVITVAMYTGMRVGEIASMTTGSVTTDAITITDAKSKAGNRTVPVHRDLRQTIARLLDQPHGKEGRLFSVSGNVASTRFRRLKQSMGYDRALVLHSIRKTVATLLEEAGVPVSTAAQLLGHAQRGDLTFGLYSGGVSLDVKREALERIAYPMSAQGKNR